MTNREIDALVLERVFACAQRDPRKFRPTSRAEDDYLVLQRVRERWPQEDCDRFTLALGEIWDRRFPGARIKSGLEGFYYEPGDHAHAALAALGVEGGE